MAKRFADLSPTEKRALLAKALQQKARQNTTAPLSFHQLRLWFLDQMDPGSPVANVSGALRVIGHVNLNTAQRVFQEIVQRHEILRTTFHYQDGEPLQVIAPAPTVPLRLIDLSELPTEQQQTEINRLVKEEARTAFDLSTGPLFRILWARCGPDEHVVCITLHHIVSDGISMAIFASELGQLYDAFSRGASSPLPALPIQYRHYARWQREHLQGERLATLLAYWRNHLDGAPQTFDLPSDRPRPAIRTFNGDIHPFALPPGLIQSLKAFSRQEGVTMFMLLLAVFSLLLHRLSDHDDILIGTPVAGRDRAETQSLIGFFVNTLVVRTRYAGHLTFRQWLRHIQDVALGAFAHQDLPFEKLIEALNPPRQLNRPVLQHVAFVHQPAIQPTVEHQGLTVSPLHVDNGLTPLDLSLFVWEGPTTLYGHFKYHTDLFDAETIAGWAEQFQTLLERVLDAPEQSLTELSSFIGSAAPSTASTNLTASFDEFAEQSDLTKNQLLIWLGQQLMPDVPLYNQPRTFTIPTRVDLDHFRRAFQTLVNSSDALRTVIDTVDGVPQQRVLAHLRASVEYVDFSGEPDPDQRAAIWLTEHAQMPFQLDQRLFYTALIKLAEERFIWFINTHHIVSDGRSSIAIAERLAELYQASQQGALPETIPLPQFQEYVAEERAYRHSDRYRQDHEYWTKKLAEPVDAITFYGQAPLIKTTRVRRISIELNAERTSRIKTLAAQPPFTAKTPEASVFNLFLVALCAYLSHIGDHRRLSIGTAFHNRRSRAFKDTIGLLMQVAPLRITVDQTDTFASLAEKARAEMLATARHAQYTIRNPAQEKTYEVLINYRTGTMPRFAGAPMHYEPIHNGHEVDSLALLIHDLNQTGRLTLVFDFHEDVFSPEQSELATQHFLSVLDALLSDSAAPINQISLLNENERRRLLVQFNQTAWQPAARERTLPALFEAQVRQHAARTAIMDEAQSLTYDQLNRRANQLAHYLQKRGVGPEAIVGVCLQPSVEAVVALLGILKAGGAFMPLDPEYPNERLAFMLRDAQVSLVLSQQTVRCALPDVMAPVISLEDELEAIAAEPEQNPINDLAAHHLAYVLYTSGSTGQPKGVMIEHEGLCNRLLWGVQTYGINPSDCMLQKNSLAYDAALQELFEPLLGGARVVIARPGGRHDSTYLARLIKEEQVTLLECVPSLLHLLLDEPDFKQCRALRYVFSGGEALPVNLIERFYQCLNAQLVNTYGPTETTIDVTHWIAERGWSHSTAPIGRPIGNVQAYVLDTHGRPTPTGVPGELHIGGVCVARGYLNRPELTEEKFIQWSGFDGQSATNEKELRLYKTGDLARYRPDGSLEFLGRLDQQVKIRGQRVELGEIESTLRQHPAVRDVAVIGTSEDSSATSIGAPLNVTRLVAYIVPHDGQGLSVGDMRAYLKPILPEHMIPSACVLLEQLPRLPNGKLDRAKLPAPDRANLARDGVYVPPRTPTEKTLATMWATVLGVERVGADDDFFELGGHSLLAMRLVSLIRKQWDVSIAVKTLFEHPTVAGLARIIDTACLHSAKPAQPIQPAPPDALLPLSYSQQALWAIELYERGMRYERPIAYDSPVALRLQGQLDIPALERSLNEIVRRHSILRATFTTHKGQPIHRIHDYAPFPLAVRDLRNSPPNKREDEAWRLGQEIINTRFDLTRGPLFRFLLARLADDDFILFISIHHLLFDGWSAGVLVRELTTLYEAFAHQRSSPLPDLKLQYTDIAYWQRQQPPIDLTEAISYWKRQLGGELPILDMRTDFPRPPAIKLDADKRAAEIPASTLHALETLSRQEGVTLFALLLAAYLTLLYRYSGQEDLIVGTPVANRTRPEIQELIGFFAGGLPLRVNLSGDPTFRQLLHRVQAVCLEALSHPDIPFDHLRDAILPPSDPSRMPVLHTFFTLQQFPTEPITLGQLTVTPLEFHNKPMTGFDLILSVSQRNQKTTTTLFYRTDLFTDQTAERLVKHWMTLLESIVAQPEQPLSRLALMSDEERRRILVEWNQADVPFPRDACLHELVAAQAERTPEAIAIVSEGQSLTYDELNTRANHLAHHLQSLGVGPDVPVGIALERGFDVIVAMLATLKAGGAYVPLDPAYPRERLAFMLRDSQCPVLLTDERLQARLFASSESSGSAPTETEQDRRAPRVVCLATFPWETNRQNPTSPVTADHLAYVMYTSGSTGAPKGVMIPHRAIVNYLLTSRTMSGMTAHDRILQKTSISFDVSVWEIFAPLLVGARMVLARAGGQRDSAYLVKLMAEQQITYTGFVPSMLELILNEPELHRCDALRVVIAGAEVLPMSLVRRFHQRLPMAELRNAYGPTETTIDVTCWVSPGSVERRTVPIGRTNANMRVYILDEQMQPTPIGVPGQLYIAGVGLARGYWNRPELTAERFIWWPCPDGSSNGLVRLYKTGDLGRFLPDGNIEFLGRNDEQIKIRGYRVEPGEIETAILRHPAVREAVVVSRADGDRPAHQLVAYLVLHEGEAVTPDHMLQFLGATLPEYMIPSAYVTLERLPLTATGKLNRRALPPPSSDDVGRAKSYVAPRTPLEATLQTIWSEVLKVDRIGIHDNFFTLGGHSLLVVQVVYRMQEVLQRDIPVSILFDAPTIAESAAVIESLNTIEASPTLAPMTVTELTSEAVLDPAIQPAAPAPDLSRLPQAVLLTGATGFLGAFLLHELLCQTEAQINCLVRAADAEAARRKIQTSMESYRIWQPSYADRILPVLGDLTEPRLGLTDAQFDELARRIDVIYHNGAAVNFVYPYSALKPTNVHGTHEVLRLACHAKTKPLHYVSTLSVWALPERSADVSFREEDHIETTGPLYGGYAQSKWVAEKLVTLARQRGLPVTIYRPGRVTGHSQTGVWNHSDLLCQIIKGWIQLQSVPDREIQHQLDLTPVDYVSRAIVYLSRQPEAVGQSFHLLNPEPMPVQMLVEWMRTYGYRLRVVPTEQWQREIAELAATLAQALIGSSTAMIMGAAHFDKLRLTEGLFTPARVIIDQQRARAGLAGSSIVCPPADEKLLQVYFQYLIDSGFLEVPPALSANSEGA
ncbi:MAG: amino acid adenylation domain-containing protein [Blastocatellia bacterium]|nr:amino acid adenylation domain-containing protein [Blastocatellia bacterium]